MGSAGLARLHGLFAAYKPPGLHWKHLRDAVETQLLKGLNARKPRAPEQRVRFLLGPAEGSGEKELTLTATSVPALASHPLVCGPAFTSLKVGVGHRLDVQASGVLVLGVGRGRSLLTDMYNAHLTKDYTVRGLLGKATDDFSEDGRLVEKTTYDHVTREKLDRILALIQGSHQKALVMHSNLDLQTQEAYEMAVKGLIRPMNKSPMLIAGIRCLHFAPPEFLLGAAHARRLLHPGRRPPADPVGPTQHPGRHPGRSPPGGSRAGEELGAGARHPAAPWSRLAVGQRWAELCLERLDSGGAAGGCG
ncbi:TruB pseudouridine synthase family member 2 [Phyllostomus discolor]|uniref:TruB pseudouridine synthase family member 2 n=1 Tax=Phyllostomus discolor TaxID=89673 RepID=A0A834ESV1_9CHIR|nr:TruB pseudouridine synthase family member 2 [Phyllostomus discolor]